MRLSDPIYPLPLLGPFQEVKDFMSNNFEMKDLGEADVILNIKLLSEGNGGITLV